MLSYHGESKRITCAIRDPDGTIWFGGEGILERLVNGHLERVALPAAIGPGHDWAIHAITRDHRGDLWVSIIQNGVYRLRGGVWTHLGNLAA
jgi:ligand-binding sensor domain-containing protein